MNSEHVLKTAHIHLENSTFRVHVDDVDNYRIEEMNEEKPEFVNSASRSSDPTQNKNSFLVDCCGTIDETEIVEMGEWIERNRK